MHQLDQILSEVAGYHPNADLTLVRRAYQFAAAAHDGQTRKSGDPYVTHPLAVAQIIAELKLDVASVCAGLLHDCVEDTSRHGRAALRAVRQGGRVPRRRRHQARQAAVLDARGAAGRELPQDAARDGARYPRHPRQALRPPRQHAVAQSPAAREAGAHRRRDDADLRAAREPARYPVDQGRARGPRVQVPLPGRVRAARDRDREDAAPSASSTSTPSRSSSTRR